MIIINLKKIKIYIYNMKSNELAILIVTFKSEIIIDKLLNKIKNFKVIIIENSDNLTFKNKIITNFPNAECILTGENIGYGCALNKVFEKYTYKNYLILNPDIIISEDEINKIYTKANFNDEIDVIAPSTLSEKNKITKRHGWFKLSKEKNSKFKNLINVDYVSGHAFLIKEHVLKKVGYFDENIFMNFEEHDLFFRIKKNNFNVYVMNNCFVVHLEGKSSNLDFYEETSLTSKWHYAWGFFYFFNKHYNKFISKYFSLIFLFNIIIKFFYFLIIKQSFKRKLMLYSLKGIIASFQKKKSHYRPKI